MFIIVFQSSGCLGLTNINNDKLYIIQFHACLIDMYAIG